METNKNRKVGLRIWQGIKFAIKWMWLLTMFLLGVTLFALLPSEIFEYSVSLSELDLVEEFYLLWLLIFTYKYVKLCLMVKAPFMRKLIIPFVYQAYFCLFVVACLMIAHLAFDFSINKIDEMPWLNLSSYFGTTLVTLYSYQVLKNSAGNNVPDEPNSLNETELSQC
ncbi:hypothetical protein [Vibrio tritonius]|uniref:hypothetical protein n=1 Tax=Vibrio tritonius TaxID=1435069 RepID=UPI00315DCC19